MDNSDLVDLAGIADRVRAERATARRAEAAREGHRRTALGLIDRCPVCGAWRFAGVCTTPHRGPRKP